MMKMLILTGSIIQSANFMTTEKPVSIHPISMKTRTPSTLPKIPCGDQLREAWLEAVDLYSIVTDLMSHLDQASWLANDENPNSKKEAENAKETIHRLTTKSLAIRDMITIWQAWASENSSLE